MSPALDATSSVKSLRDILENKKYGIDFFQRGYMWERRQIEQLLHDLESKFSISYSEEHEVDEVDRYPKYYMGTIITSSSGGRRLIVDGQQRLTSITLLLIYLNNLQKSHPLEGYSTVQMDPLIFSEKFNKRSYNLDIRDRMACMDSLYKGTSFTAKTESDHNITRAYRDIEDLSAFQPGTDGLVHFIWWLMEKVSFVEINMATDDDAYAVFETMNDRGLSLTPTEMLKGYLLAKTGQDVEKDELAELWKGRIAELRKRGKDEDSEFFKAWLRAKCAITIRPGKKDAENEDFENIGTVFHNWVRENEEKAGLGTTQQYREFIKSKFDYYSNLYLQIRRAAGVLTPGLEHVYYIESLGVPASFYYPALMAPVMMDDDEAARTKKIDMAARFLETFYIYRKVNRRTTAYSSIRHAIFADIKEMRDKSVEDLAALLEGKAGALVGEAGWPDDIRMRPNTKKMVRYLLGRITSHIEDRSNMGNRFAEYVRKTSKNPYSIEHVLASKFERDGGEFADEEEFEEWRNSLGALILMPVDFNRSYGALPYDQKLGHYYSQNLLARSLNAKCYQNNPSFTAYADGAGLPFTPHPVFGKEEIRDRQKLYAAICSEIWDPGGFL